MTITPAITVIGLIRTRGGTNMEALDAGNRGPVGRDQVGLLLNYSRVGCAGPVAQMDRAAVS